MKNINKVIALKKAQKQKEVDSLNEQIKKLIVQEASLEKIKNELFINKVKLLAEVNLLKELLGESNPQDENNNL